MVALAVIAVAMSSPTPTGAELSDFDRPGDNEYESGTLDISVGWNETVNGQPVENVSKGDDPGAIFNVSNIEPGDNGTAVVNFTGETNPYWLEFSVNQTAGPELPAYYQVDFVEGEVIEQLDHPDSLYGDRKIDWKHGNVLDPSYTRSDPRDSGCVDTRKMDFDHESYEVNVSFKLDGCGGEKQLTLASYEKPSGGGWKPDEADEQELVDSETAEYADGEWHSVTVDLPEPGNGIGDALQFLVWYDGDGDGERDGGETVIANDTAHEVGQQLSYGRLLDAAPSSQNQLAFGDQQNHIGFSWRLPVEEEFEDVCSFQDQKKVFDIGFNASQERNNPGADLVGELGFNDKEVSIDNSFETGSFPSCTVCEEVDFPGLGDQETFGKTWNGSDTGETVYGTEVKNGSVKFEADGGDQLGEDAALEAQIFKFTAESSTSEIPFRIKDGGGPDAEEYNLSGVNDTVEAIGGDFNVTLLSMEDNGDGTTTYRIEVVATPSEEGDSFYALSFIQFSLCGELPERKGGSGGGPPRGGGGGP